MANPYIAEIMIFGFGFAPRNWMFCNGQILAISTNQALFSLLGTVFGGDGRTTFGLPDLRGRATLGTGPGFVQGQVGGEAAHTLTTAEIPQHTHLWQGNKVAGTVADPTGNALGGNNIYAPNAAPAAMNAGTIGAAGGSQPHPNMSPYLVLNYCIATQGIFPSRS